MCGRRDEGDGREGAIGNNVRRCGRRDEEDDRDSIGRDDGERRW